MLRRGAGRWRSASSVRAATAQRQDDRDDPHRAAAIATTATPASGGVARLGRDARLVRAGGRLSAVRGARPRGDARGARGLVDRRAARGLRRRAVDGRLDADLEHDRCRLTDDPPDVVPTATTDQVPLGNSTAEKWNGGTSSYTGCTTPLIDSSTRAVSGLASISNAVSSEGQPANPATRRRRSPRPACKPRHRGPRAAPTWGSSSATRARPS